MTLTKVILQSRISKDYILLADLNKKEQGSVWIKCSSLAPSKEVTKKLFGLRHGSLNCDKKGKCKEEPEQRLCLGEVTRTHISSLMTCFNFLFASRKKLVMLVPFQRPMSQLVKKSWRDKWKTFSCTLSIQGEWSKTQQNENCSSFSLRPLSVLKCYDSVINLLDKLIVQTVFQEECLNYLWEQTFKYPQAS